jgi:uroporphyrinogen decarboxylase
MESMYKSFQPDYNNLLAVLNNQRPDRIPLYEHHIDAPFISKVTWQEDNRIAWE